MKFIRLVILIFLLKGQAFALPSSFQEAGIGAGYEDNLNHSASSGRRKGDAFGMAWLSGGISKEINQRHSFFAGLGYEGLYFGSYNDLTTHRLSAKGGLIMEAGKNSLISFDVKTAKSASGDSDRDAEEASLSLSLSSMLSPEITVSVGVSYINHDAEESVFSYETRRLDLDCEFELSEKNYLTAAYSREYSETTFYIDLSTPMPLDKRGRRSGTFESDQLVISDDTKAHIISVDMEHSFKDSAYLLIAYTLSLVESDYEDFHNSRIIAAVGIKF